MQQTNTKSENEIIAENETWFKFFVTLPKVTTIFFAIVCLILGIVFAVTFGAIFLLVFWGGGIVFCALNYAVLKLVLSYQILQIYYLKKISLNNNGIAKDTSEAPEELPEI